MLDIDLDFFLSDIEHFRTGRGRLPDGLYVPWRVERVAEYLVEQCGLNPAKAVPGSVVRQHHEVFDIWRRLVQSGELCPPFDVVHIDAHADLGMGDAGWCYIMGELLHRPVSDRTEPKRGTLSGLRPGNFLLFAIACRWIRSLTYVHHPRMRERNCGKHDIPDLLFRDNDPTASELQLKVYPQDCRWWVTSPTEHAPLRTEPAVPIAMVDCDDYQQDRPFDFAFVSHSPSHTPPAADVLLDVIGSFVDSRSVG